MRLGDIPGFSSMPPQGRLAIAGAGRIVNLPAGAPVVVAGLPADLTWILLEGELVEVTRCGRPSALLSPLSIASGGTGGSDGTSERSLYCATAARLLAVPVRELGPAPELAVRVERAPPDATAHVRHDIELSVRWLQDVAPGDLLEVGAGAGLYSRFLLGVCKRLTITDPLDQALRTATERLRWSAGDGAVVRAARCRGESIAAGAGSHDAVVTRMALHHMDSVGGFLQEARRVLRPGGYLLAIDLLGPEHDAARALVNERERRLDASHRTVITRSQILALLRQNGFKAERFEVTTVRTSLRDLGARGARPAGAVEATANWLAGVDAEARRVLGVVELGEEDAEWVDERFVVLAQAVAA